jgi:hypothetical protein
MAKDDYAELASEQDRRKKDNITSVEAIAITCTVSASS